MRTLFSLLLGFVLLSGTALTCASQQIIENKEQPAQEQLRARVKTFYEDILRNDLIAALDLVAPESKNQFLNNHYDNLADFRISSMEIAPTGDRATVKVVRVTRLPNFSHTLELNMIDAWQLSNGQWFYVLPSADELDTPFGKIKFDPNNRPSDAEVQEMKARVEKAYKNVDADQYIRALQQATNGAATSPKGGEQTSKEGPSVPSKPDGKKPADTSPATDSTKPPK